MHRHMARHVHDIVGGERATHFTAKRPAGLVPLDSGPPSFPTPAHIREAAKRALDDGLTAYALGQGDPEFLQAVPLRRSIAGERRSPAALHGGRGRAQRDGVRSGR